jgi:hypothetical protein
LGAGASGNSGFAKNIVSFKVEFSASHGSLADADFAYPRALIQEALLAGGCDALDSSMRSIAPFARAILANYVYLL